MSELALIVWTFFVLGIGLTLMWMWSRLEIFDLHETHAEELAAKDAELEEAYAKYAEWMARALANETRVAWLSSYIGRLDQELEAERIISESFAAGIARQER